MNVIVSIAAGGALGAISRFWVSGWIYQWLGRDFPWGTLGVNVIGSFMMGLLSILMVERMQLGPEARAFVLVGFLGAFTTFSTFSMETWNLLSSDQWLKASLNMIISVAACVIAVIAGVLSGRQWL